VRIALLHYSSPPVVGGVEQIIGAHARLFAKHGHAVAVLSQRGDADIRLETGASEETHRALLRPAVAGCDVVFAHNVMTMPFDLALTRALAGLATDLASTRFVAWTHDVATLNPDLAPVSAELGRAVPRFEYVAVSQARAAELASVSGVSARVIPNGIDPAAVLGIPETLTAFAEAFHLFDGRFVLLHPTRLLRRKNVELGLQALAERRDANMMLLITGAEDSHNPASAAYAASLRAARKDLALEQRAIFVSDHLPIGDAEMSGLYQLADALFLPSRQEGFGLPVLEAALHRMPAFISDLAPLQEIAGASARRFDPQIPASELAPLILETLQADPTVRARKHALRFRWEAIYRAYVEPLLSGN
jgi:mannosylglucosylglycerate synthase